MSYVLKRMISIKEMNKVFGLLFWLSSITSPGASLQMESFVEDLMEGIASTRPAFIFHPDNEVISKWDGGKRSMALIGATGSFCETVLVTEHLRFLIENDDLDSIFVLSSGLNALIRNVTETLEVLRSKINVVVPYGDSEGLRPRFNSRLFLYESKSEKIMNLYESYKIR